MSYLASAASYNHELTRWHHRRIHSHHTESSSLDHHFYHTEEAEESSREERERERSLYIREGFAVGFGTVWTWNSLLIHSAARDRERALLHAAATLIQQAEALLLHARRDR